MSHDIISEHKNKNQSIVNKEKKALTELFGVADTLTGPFSFTQIATAKKR